MQAIKEINDFVKLFPEISLGVIFLLGAVIGSFLNVFIYRYPIIFKRENLQAIKDYFEELGWGENEKVEAELKKPKVSLSFPRSHCPKCNNLIKWYHNIPIISYFLLKGKCSHCGEKFSSSYMIVELLTGVVLAGGFLLLKTNQYWAVLLMLLLVTWAMSLIDIKALMIPDEMNYFLLWIIILLASFGYHPLGLDLKETVLGAITGYAIIFTVGGFSKLILKKDGIGQGDYKLIAGLGALVGIKGAIFTFFFSPFIGITFWLIVALMSLLDKEKVERIMPFGPSLIMACWIYAIYGDAILKKFL